MQPDLPPTQPTAASSQRKHFNRLIIPMVLMTLLLFGALGFGFWANSQANDYKNNVTEKVEEQLAERVKKAEEAKEAEFVEREKEPLKTYTSPSAFGSVAIKYPKTWSAYVVETGGNTALEGYFHPNVVPGKDSGTAFALHFEVMNDEYADVLKQFDAASKNGAVTITALKPANVSNVSGSRIDGQITRDRRGSVVLFPLRDKTLRLTTEAEEYVKDFNNIILANLVFTP